ncbi:MAG: ADP-glyceromanno-heptose 6-epimerase [Deltaproteobacteria bacterium]|nr:ADP-glyceromanno-heptose 6-epimerase [Deltaproteobacteria bacterium]RLB89867.1 MAG: ADP-glyceromanno-heptose 6-epimerase [Deltaproteobacteria bacterium]
MIIVTGGAGFIGSAFVWKLNSEGIDDIIIVDKLGASEKWRNLVNRHFLDYIHKDKFLNILCENRLTNISAIIHMGACSSTTERDADYLMENNYGYSKALAEWACKNNVRFIYASSAATYGDGSRTFSDDDATTATLQPLNMYGYSKHLFDLWALRNRLSGKITGIKFFNVFGPNEYHKGDMVSVVFKAFHQIVETGRVKLFKSYRNEYRDGEQMRDFVYVLDCVNIMWWFLQHPEATGIFNLGSGTARTWNDLAKAVFSALGRKTLIEYIEMPESIRDRYQYFSEARMEKLASAGCSLKFRSLEDAVHDYVVNYLAKGNLCL